MSVNRGKQFELEIRKGLEALPNTSIDRLYDPMAGFSGIKNICDFIVYQHPVEIYLECKSVGGGSLNFKTGITDTQWLGLLDKSQIRGVAAGLVIWFKDHDITIYVPIQELDRLRNEGAKSVRVRNLEELDHIVVEGKKRRVLFTYNLQPLLDEIKGGFYVDVK